MNMEEDFATLFEQTQTSHGALAVEGDIVTGKVIAINPDVVIVDFGHKSEGQIPIEEFKTPKGEVTIKIGDSIEVYLENMDLEDGLAILSKEKADALKIWDHLQEVMDKEGTIDGVVLYKVKGGLSVDIGVKAFLPSSQIDVRMPGSLDKLIGRKFKFKILKLNKRKGNIIVSRRALMEKDRDFARNEVLQNISEGQAIAGTVKNVTDYGAFIDLGGIDGLLHITDMSWGRAGHPSEILSVGKEVTVKILKIDPESGKVSLGLKQLAPDPWEKVLEKYTPGERVKGRVVNLADYGAFIELESGVEGLVHISEMSWSRKAKHPSKIVSVGDVVEAAILDIDVPSRRISLGMKQIMANPWESIHDKFPAGTKIEGPVKNVTDFGVFVGLSDDIDGLVHVSDVAWVRPARPLAQIFPKKSVIQAVVLSIDAENERVSLGMKQLVDDIWSQIQGDIRLGARHKGPITWVGEKGLAVEIKPGVEGFVALAELDEEGKPVSTDTAGEDDPTQKYSIGQEVEVAVYSVDEKERRILLGLVQ